MLEGYRLYQRYILYIVGDALFFHSNLLHTSNANDSQYRRWAFLCAYNRKSNNPIIEHHHPQYCHPSLYRTNMGLILTDKSLRLCSLVIVASLCFIFPGISLILIWFLTTVNIFPILQFVKFLDCCVYI